MKKFQVKSDTYKKFFLFSSDIWALGCVLYEMCTLKHAVSRHFWSVFKIMSKSGYNISFFKKIMSPFRQSSCSRNSYVNFKFLVRSINLNRLSLNIYAYITYASYMFVIIHIYFFQKIISKDRNKFAIF